MKRRASGSGLTVKDVPCHCMQTDRGLLMPLGSEARKAGPSAFIHLFQGFV